MLFAASCTGNGTPTAQQVPSPATSASRTPEPTATGSTALGDTLVLGQALPVGCATAPARPEQTVAFVAQDRAWALDPVSGRLSCLFDVTDPGPFAWGPQGDRVLLGDTQIRFLTGRGDLAIGAPPPQVFDWGRPIGKAVVFNADTTSTRKFTLADDRLFNLPDMPDGTYEDIAYHPSGLALAISVKANDGIPQIFVSTNEGERPERIVVGVSATDFPSLDFTSDGRYLLYLAQHKGDYAQLHMIDLAHPNAGLIDLWKSASGVTASGLRLPPGIGDTLAFTTGAACEDSVAVTGSVDAVAPALPDEARPTRAIGYLDDQRLLVSAGGCGSPNDLYVVDATGATQLVTRADLAAARSNGPDEGAPLPEQLLGQVQEFG